MKALKIKDWDCNPREMYVWDGEPDTSIGYTSKVFKRKVVYYRDISKYPYPVVALSEDGTHTEYYSNCAEIESMRVMTNKELSRWLRGSATREWKMGDTVSSCATYEAYEADKEVDPGICIREDDGPWHKPLVENK